MMPLLAGQGNVARAHYFVKVDTVVRGHFCVYTFAVVSAYAEQEFIS